MSALKVSAPVSQREFARLAGADEKQVRRALQRGTLKADANGLLDPSQISTDWRRIIRSSRAVKVELSAPESKRVSARQPTVTMTAWQIEAFLRERDWRTEFDWSDAALHARASAAVACAGLVFDHRESGPDRPWSGYQVRTRKFATSDAPFWEVVAGFGFELDEHDVIRACRAELLLSLGDQEAPPESVRLDLLPMLAFPHVPWQRKRAQD